MPWIIASCSALERTSMENTSYPDSDIPSAIYSATVSGASLTFARRKPLQRFLPHRNLLEPPSQFRQRILHRQSLEARRADEANAIRVLVDVSGVFRRADGPAV